MASRLSGRLAITTSQTNTSIGGLPSPSNSERSSFTSTALPLPTHPTLLAISFEVNPTELRLNAPTLLRQRSFSGTDDDVAAALFASMNRRPSLPVNHLHHHPMERHPSYDPRRQQGYLGHHPFRQSQISQPLTVGGNSRPLTPVTPTLISPSSSTSSLDDDSDESEIRHPLWKLECRICTTVMSEQAMQGHLASDPSSRQFSTNQALGVRILPDQPVSLCPCKYQHFACGSCGTVCGYSLTQPCDDCQLNRGNGHGWIFYAHKVNAQWRTIETDKDSTGINKGNRNMFWDDLSTWSHDKQKKHQC